MQIKKALGKNIFIRYLDKPIAVGLIVIPDSIDRNSVSDGTCLRAEVIAVGSKVKVPIEVGQIVAVNKRLGTRLDNNLAVYDPEDVYCIIEKV